MSQHARLLTRGIRPVERQPVRLGVLMLALFLLPTFSPWASASTLQVASDDFGVLGLLEEVLSDRAGAADDPEVGLIATGSLTGVEANLRDSGEGDPLAEVDTQLSKVSLRDTTPPQADNPRPYELLLDPSTQPTGFPSNLVDTIFGLENWQLTDPLAIGLNTYVIYVNYSARNSGPQYESWTVGTFTGDLISEEGFTPFENHIDLDGDGNNDVFVGLTIIGILESGWGIEYSDDLIPIPETLWVRPTFQWRVRMENPNDPLWDAMESMEVTLMKGFAYNINLGDDGEAYAFVIDTRFTQPPYDFQLQVGIERMDFDITAVAGNLIGAIGSALIGGLDESQITITSVHAPYKVTMVNPNEPGSSRQTACEDGWYDPGIHHGASSREHRCALGLGLGYIHFDTPASDGTRDVLEVAYIDASFHPIAGSVFLPEEADLGFRNDNIGEDSLDTVEYYADRRADLFIHYYEDRSNFSEPGDTFGNITDADAWFRGLPSGTMTQDEINALFTMMGAEPGSLDLPGQVPQERLSMLIGIKNFSRDDNDNVDDPTLPINPAEPPMSMIVIALSEEVESLELTASVRRYGSDNDHSRIHLRIENIPKVLIVHGSFELPAGGGIRVLYDNPTLDLFSQFLDNILLGLVEIILDVGGIVQGLPMAIVSTAGESGGEVTIDLYNQIQSTSFNGLRQIDVVGMIALELGSSAHPIIGEGDHIALGFDRDLSPVAGRVQMEEPLVPVGMSTRIHNVSRLHHSFDPVQNIRIINLLGTTPDPLDIAFLSHSGGTLENSQHQFAHLSERPLQLNITQTTERVVYDADRPLGTIVYAAHEGVQSNAIQLDGLPDHFEIIIGDELGYEAELPIESITVQITNSSNPRTMNGDHFYFWQDELSGEAELSARLSNITNLRRTSPEVPGASGPQGNGHVSINRSESDTFRVLIRDDTAHSDPHLGLNATILLEPLPASLAFDYPSDVDSSGLAIPSMGENEGVSALAFFLGDMVNFGRTISDLVSGLTRDLAGGSSDDDVALGLDLEAGEPFSITVEMEKGDMVSDEPNWMHGGALHIEDRSQVSFNLSGMLWLTSTPRQALEAIMDDGIISVTEKDEFILICGENILQASLLADALKDGRITEDEWENLDETQLMTEGISVEERRSWHLRAWLPNLPPTIRNLGYQYSLVDDVPTYDFQIDLEGWTPGRENVRFELNGVEGRDVAIEISGLDTTLARDATVRAQLTSDTSFTVPRAGVDLHYELGEPLDYVHAIMVDQVNAQRVETLLKGVPGSADLAATIGDILLLDFSVPEYWRNGSSSAEAAMISMMRFVDGRWWPATAFMRDLPGEMHLAAQPSTEFDITAQTAFQGMYTLSYSSNTDTMDLYLEANGRAIDARSDTLLLAEDLPQITSISLTEDWGLRISSSGDGIGRLYYRQTDTPMTDYIYLHSLEAAGENLQSATIHVGGHWMYPVVIIDDITGGRIIATARADVEFAGVNWDARAVLIDAQATGVIPSGSTFGVNGVVSDLSLVNSLTGGRAETTHVIVAEPLSTAILTVVSTILGGGG